MSATGALTYGAPLRIEEVKAAGDAWEVSGYVSTFGNVDLGGDVIHKGAFADTLKSGAKVRFLYAHDARQVLGTAVSLKEDDKGVFGRFRISKTRLGEEVHTLLKDGALDSFSIGYIPTTFDFDDNGIRHLKAVELLESSVVAIPMNPMAMVTGIKAADYSRMPLEDVLHDLRDRRTAANTAIKAMAERRQGEGRRLSDRVVELLELLRQDALEDADTLLALTTTPTPEPTEAKADVAPERPEAPPVDDAPVETADGPPAPLADVHATVKAAGLVEAHLRRARLARHASKLRDVVLPPYDPVAHLARLEVPGVLTRDEEPSR